MNELPATIESDPKVVPRIDFKKMLSEKETDAIVQLLGDMLTEMERRNVTLYYTQDFSQSRFLMHVTGLGKRDVSYHFKTERKRRPFFVRSFLSDY